MPPSARAAPARPPESPRYCKRTPRRDSAGRRQGVFNQHAAGVAHSPDRYARAAHLGGCRSDDQHPGSTPELSGVGELQPLRILSQHLSRGEDPPLHDILHAGPDGSEPVAPGPDATTGGGRGTHIQDFTLAYSYEGYWGDILAGIGSTDQTGNYVFPVVPSAVYKGGARASHYWLADGGFDTMSTLWNPQPDAEDVLVTIKYGGAMVTCTRISHRELGRSPWATHSSCSSDTTTTWATSTTSLAGQTGRVVPAR